MGTQKAFCWTPQALIGLIGLVVTAICILWGAASYFGGVTKAAEQVASEQDRATKAYSVLGDKFDAVRESQIRTEEKIRGISDRLEKVEKKVDKLGR